MEELRQEFLREAVAVLETLQNSLSAEENNRYSEALRRELFRRLHTLKGSSQTFNFNDASALAHEIENLLQAERENKILPDEEFLQRLSQGLKILSEYFQNALHGNKSASGEAFIEKIRSFIPGYAPARKNPANELKHIPPQFLGVLSPPELKLLASRMRNGENFYLLEAIFDLPEFSERFKQFKEVLNLYGETIAAAPAADALPGTIGFRFYFASRVPQNKIRNVIEPFAAEILFARQRAPAEFPKNLHGVLTQIVSAGRQTAQDLGKEIDFEIDAENIEIPAKQLKIIFEASLHIVRNAVDHAIEPAEERISAQKSARGKISLESASGENGLILRIADDGRGVDLEKIKTRAVREKLIPSDADLSEKEVLALIFAHGLTTSEQVTEVSGRGVGLDAVKDAIESAGGSIRVFSRRGRGTTFEIRLPGDE